MNELLSRARYRRDHRWAPDRMSAYLDGQLACSRRTRLERHVQECPECHGLLASLRGLLGALQSLPAPAGDIDGRQLAAAVLRRLPERPGS